MLCGDISPLQFCTSHPRRSSLCDFVLPFRARWCVYRVNVCDGRYVLLSGDVIDVSFYSFFTVCIIIPIVRSIMIPIISHSGTEALPERVGRMEMRPILGRRRADLVASAT